MENFYKRYDLTRLFMNITDNFKHVKDDYIGINFNFHGIMNVLADFLIAISLILLFYLIGRKIRLLFFKGFECQNTLALFVNIALGYIIVNTGIAILGIFSLFYTEILLIYIISLFSIAICPISDLIHSIKDIFKNISSAYLFFSKHKLFFIGIFLFILISFLRLIPPEIGEDSVGYHTDLPLLYLNSHSMIIEARDTLHVIPIPQLGEMSYVITEFLGFRDASRYVHFMFYILVIALLCYISKKNIKLLGLYPPILFITASVIIRHASKANVDFQALFCWFMAFYIIIKDKKLTNYSVILSAIFFGGALSTKLWEIVFFPAFLAYIIFTQKNKWHGFKSVAIFSFFAFLISFIWFVRSYIITGNPVFPAFAHLQPLEKNIGGSATFFDYIGFNFKIFSYSNLVVFSPIFFLGIIFLLSKILNVFNKIKRSTIFYFFTILGVEHIFILYYLPRYLLNLYAVFILIVSFGIYEFCSKIKLGKYFISVIFAILFFYYFTNTLLILPYGFGWADSNKYLTRVLFRDNSSYYDFDHLFNKWISSKDRVATYGIYGYYYANFNYIDINYIFDKDNRSFDLLLQKNVTKLFVRGGDILWFCKTLSLYECSSSKVKLLASYPKEVGKYNLYSIISKI